MIAFIDDHRDVHGNEPICKVLPIAPSTYHKHVAQRQDVSREDPPAEPGASLNRVQIDTLVFPGPPEPLDEHTIHRPRPSMLIRTLASRNTSVQSLLLNWLP